MSAEDTSPADVALSYGGFWRRDAAAIVDGILLVPVNLILESMTGTPEGIAFAAFVVQAVYEVGMTASAKQATIGKLIFGLRVVDNDGRRLTAGRATGRFLAKILSALLACIGFLMIAFTQRKRGLHDMLAGTLVVRMAPALGPATKLPA